MAMMAQQTQLALQQSQTNALNGQAAESQARAAKLAVEAQIAPEELEIDKINAITRNLKEGDQEDREFERRLKVADRLLKKRQLEAKPTNVNDTNGNEQTARPDQPSVQGSGRQNSMAPEALRLLGGEG